MFFAAARETTQDHFEFLLNVLRPFVEYEIVRTFFPYSPELKITGEAVADEGFYAYSPRSRVINITTANSFPTAPYNNTLVDAGPQELQVSWSIPIHPNGVVSYYEAELARDNHKVSSEAISPISQY